MKAHYNPLTRQQRRTAHAAVKREVAELIDAERALITYRIMAIVCFSLHENYGWGRLRLCRLIKDLERQATDFESWDDIREEIMDKGLRQMKMHELADVLKDVCGKATHDE